jgi:ligand-binding SRPBCC domain-containing protein
MPVYQYEGVHYDLPEGLSNDQAVSKIKGYLGVSTQPKLPAQTGEATPESMVTDPSNPFSYLGQEQQTSQGPAMQAVGQGVNRALQVGAGVTKGAILNPVAAITQMVGGDTGQQFTSEMQKAYAQQRANAGATGFDFAEVGGALVSPVNRLLPRVTATTAAGRATQYGGQGALLGLLTPAEDAQNLISEKLQQAGAGALFGGILSGALDLGKGALTIAKEFAKPITTAGQKTILQERLVELAGKEPEKIINALRNAPEIVPGSKPTAAEALADIPAATSLAAFQKSLEKSPALGISADFAVRRADVANARKSLLQKTAGTQDDLIEAIAQRTRATAPLRENALSQANIAGELAPQFEQQIAQKFASKAQALQTQGVLGTEAAQQQQLARNFFPVPGYPRVGPELSNNFDRVLGNLEGAKVAKDIAAQRQAEGQFKKLQLQSLADNGFYPLRVSPIIENIDNVLQKPGERASDVVVNVFSSLKDKLQRLSNPQTGVIDSNDLYTIRKEIGNDIKKFSSESQNWDAKLTSGLEKNVKSYIDNAIEKAGNSGDWKRYLDTFQQESTKINQIQIAQALEKQIGTPLGNAERVAGFAAAMENAPNLIKRSTGQARFQKLDDIMTKSQMDDFNSVLADVSREAKGDTLASLSTADRQALLELPNMLNRYALITNTVLKLIKKDATAEINRLAADMTLNPPLLAAFIEGVPPSKSQAVVKAFLSKLSLENQAALNRSLIIKAVVPQITEGEQ